MAPVSLDNLKSLLQSASMLSTAEREEWLALLPFMNDKQLSDLSTILQPQAPAQPELPPSVVAAVPTTPPPPTPLAATVPSALEQSVPATAEVNGVPVWAPPSAGAQQPATSAESNSVSAFIHRAFGSKKTAPVRQVDAAPGLAPTPIASAQPILSASPVSAATVRPPSSTPPTTVPAPQRDMDMKLADNSAAQDASREAEKPPTEAIAPAAHIETPPVAQEPEAVEEPVVQSVKGIGDVHLLNVTTLRARGALTLEQELKKLCQSVGYFSVQLGLEQSPLYQTYLTVGSKVLQDHESFEIVQAALSGGHQPFLTKPEFEEVNDMLRHLKSAT